MKGNENGLKQTLQTLKDALRDFVYSLCCFAQCGCYRCCTAAGNVVSLIPAFVLLLSIVFQERRELHDSGLVSVSFFEFA